jgi:hypothetical protein
MEIEVKPISLESRLEYLNTISETQQANTKKFPWLNSVIFLLIGAGIVYGITQYQKSKENKGAK